MSLFHSVLHIAEEVNNYSDEICDGQQGNDRVNSFKNKEISNFLGLHLFLKMPVKVDITNNLRRDGECAVTETLEIYLVKRVKTLLQDVFLCLI